MQEETAAATGCSVNTVRNVLASDPRTRGYKLVRARRDHNSCPSCLDLSNKEMALSAAERHVPCTLVCLHACMLCQRQQQCVRLICPAHFSVASNCGPIYTVILLLQPAGARG